MAIRIDGISPIRFPESEMQARGTAKAADAKDFGQFLKEALESVESAQQEAAASAERLAMGNVRDLSEVIIASEKATLALQMTVQVRNKILEAYQEIMRMQV